MDPEQRRALQNERLRTMVERIFDQPVTALREKLTAAGVESAADVNGVDDLARSRSPSSRTCATRRPTSPPWGDLPLHRPAPGSATRHLDRHHRAADHHRVDRRGPLGRVRVGGPQLVAHGLPAGDDRHPRPPGLSLRRRGDAAGDLRVLRPADPVGAPARHRRARRAGGPVLDPGHPGHPLHGLRHRTVHRGGDQARHPARGRRASPG